MQHENRIKLEACPICGVERPEDWFGPELKYVERNRLTAKTERVIRYRKYVACWRCRELRANRDRRVVPVEELL